MKTIKKVLNSTWNIIKETKKNFQEDEPIVYSASIAFFTIFSLPAILIVITLIGSAFFEEEDVRKEIILQIEDAVNMEAADQVAILLENAVDIPDGFWYILLGILLIVKSATIIFFIMQKALNSVWNVQVKSNVNYLEVMKHRLITLAIVIGLGGVVVLSILLDAMFVVFSDQLKYLFEEYLPPAVRVIRNIFSITVVFIFFTVVHKQLPDVDITWEDALAGGLITSILFLIGKELIDYVLSNIKIIGIYATAGSLVILLLWVFYSSIILVLGAEFTKAYANQNGRKSKSNSIAVKFKKEIQYQM
jgi:membrane protein